MQTKDKADDLIIMRENLGTAISGDIVRVEPAGMAPGRPGEKPRPAAKVVEVITRTRTTFVGPLIRAENDPNLTLVAPDWKRMHVPVRVTDTQNIPFGNKVLVEITHWNPGSDLPDGIIREDIGKAGAHETEMRALALGQGFSPNFPPGVEKEAEELEEQGQALIDAEVPNRRDFRNITTFTIDPFDAKDFDDALSVRTLPDGNIEVGVHIADVSHFVRPGTSIDAEARERATSVYLVDRTIPMLPHVLSTNLCSLNPNVDRLAVSAVFTLDKDANIIDRWFGKTAIHSSKRFTYEEAQEVLTTGTGPLIEELTIIRDLARKIRTRRVEHGAVEFDTVEIKVILDAEGKPTEIRTKNRQETNLLIEDFMLLANVAVAEHLSELSNKGGREILPIYRVHDAPDADRIEALTQFLRVMGYDLDAKAGRVKGAALNKLIRETKGTPEEYLIKTATLRSMSKAVYATRNAGHFGLAFEHYTHFTSPIRRYPDLMIHRLLKYHEHGEEINAKELAEFDRMAAHASEREVGASDAERDSIKMKLAEYMANHIGEEFDAVISGVNERGLYVELNETHAEGMVNVRSIGDDYYTYDEKHYRLVGERTKTSFQLGRPVRVRLIAARPLERELDFELVRS